MGKGPSLTFSVLGRTYRPIREVPKGGTPRGTWVEFLLNNTFEGCLKLSTSFLISSHPPLQSSHFSASDTGGENWISPLVSHPAWVARPSLTILFFLRRIGHFHQINQPQTGSYWEWDITGKVSLTTSAVIDTFLSFSVCWILHFRVPNFGKFSLIGECLPNSALTQFLFFPNSGKKGPDSLTGSSGSTGHMESCLSFTNCIGEQDSSWAPWRKVKGLEKSKMYPCFWIDV